MPKQIFGNADAPFSASTVVPRDTENVDAIDVERPIQDVLNNNAVLYAIVTRQAQQIAALTAQQRGVQVVTAQTQLSLEPSRNYTLNNFVRVVRLGDLSDDILLSALNVPAGVTLNFADSTLSGDEAGSDVVITTSGSLVAGTYDIQFRAESGAYSAQALVKATLVVASKPREFTLGLFPSASIERAVGASTTTSVVITRLGGFDDPVSIDGVNLPAGLTLSAAPNPIVGTDSFNIASATLILTADAALPTGAYSITVRGQGGGVVRTNSLTLNVSPAPAQAGNPDFTVASQPSSGSGLLAAVGDLVNNGVTVKINRSGGFTSPVTVEYVNPPREYEGLHPPDILINGQPGRVTVTGDTFEVTANGSAYGWSGSGTVDNLNSAYIQYLATISVLGRDPTWAGGIRQRFADVGVRVGRRSY